MDAELQQAWNGLTSNVGDLEELVSATRAFLDLSSDEVLEEDAPYIAELVLGARPPSDIVSVLEAAWSFHGAPRRPAVGVLARPACPSTPCGAEPAWPAAWGPPGGCGSGSSCPRTARRCL
jgi:hypothetical protein